MEKIAKHALAVAVVGILVLLGLTGGAFSQGVTYERLLNADKEPHNWLTYYGSYKGWRYSSLNQINTTNVKRLVVKWAFPTGPDKGMQATPIVVDGIMYLANAQNSVFALDAANGRLLWRFNYELPEEKKMPMSAIWGRQSRGVSVANGKVLMGTLDSYLVAVDAKTGKLLWKTPAADAEEGRGFTSPPVIVKDKAIVGLATLEFPGRGFIDAYDIETGKLSWRFYTIPGPGERGNETWGPGDAWKYGCAAAWLPATYDPELNTVYMGTGQPCPDHDGDVRPGDNLYSDSIIALDPDTGSMKWYFQTIPHDVWDLDTTNELVLVDTEIQRKPVKALFQANKNGYFYALDRTDGRLLYATPFVSRINWTKGLDPRGRPVPGVAPTPEGAVVCPTVAGGKSWNHMAYSPQRGYVYIPATDMCVEVKVVRVKPRTGVLYVGGEWGNFSEHDPQGALVAIDVKTGEKKWEYRAKYPMPSSVLATAGGLVFTGDLEGNALAFDDANGVVLWKFNTGSGHRGSPIAYAVNGKQYIAVPSGLAPPWGPAGWIAPKLGDMPQTSTLFVFGLFEE